MPLLRHIITYKTTNEIDGCKKLLHLSKLNHGSYSYYVYVNVAGYKVEVTLSKGLSLSEEIKAVSSEAKDHEIVQNEGKWNV